LTVYFRLNAKFEGRLGAPTGARTEPTPRWARALLDIGTESPRPPPPTVFGGGCIGQGALSPYRLGCPPGCSGGRAACLAWPRRAGWAGCLPDPTALRPARPAPTAFSPADPLHGPRPRVWRTNPAANPAGFPDFNVFRCAFTARVDDFQIDTYV